MHGVELTIVALSPQPLLLRPGAVPLEAIEAVLGTALLAAPSQGNRPTSPGRLTHHYAPRTPLRLVDPQQVPARERTRAAIVTLSQLPEGYAHARRLSERGSLREAAARLFETLHELDELELDRIDVEPVPETGLGVAIMDRLRRAAV